MRLTPRLTPLLLPLLLWQPAASLAQPGPGGGGTGGLYRVEGVPVDAAAASAVEARRAALARPTTAAVS